MTIHLDLLDAGPVAAECEVSRAIEGLLEDVRVDEVVAAVLRQADRAVIGPGSGAEGSGGRDTDLGMLRADEGDRVVAVPSAVALGYRRCLARGLSDHTSTSKREASYPYVLIIAQMYACSVV